MFLTSDSKPFMQDIDASHLGPITLWPGWLTTTRTMNARVTYLEVWLAMADKQRMCLGLANLVVATAKWAAKRMKNEALAKSHSTNALERFMTSLKTADLDKTNSPHKYGKFLMDMSRVSSKVRMRECNVAKGRSTIKEGMRWLMRSPSFG